MYLSPPNRVIVLCVDEKSQIQALDQEQPVLPMMPGVAERRPHSYISHGTASLFAAPDIATGPSSESVFVSMAGPGKRQRNFALAAKVCFPPTFQNLCNVAFGTKGSSQTFIALFVIRDFGSRGCVK